jgi:hypothetical protein
MNTTQQIAELQLRPRLRISEVERAIRIHRIILPPLSRRSILRMCEDGTFETAPRSSGRSPYFIYEDSFLDWVKSLDQVPDQ